MTVQLALIAAVYFLSCLFMYALGLLPLPAPQMPGVILGAMCLFFLVLNGILFRSVLSCSAAGNSKRIQ